MKKPNHIYPSISVVILITNVPSSAILSPVKEIGEIIQDCSFWFISSNISQNLSGPNKKKCVVFQLFCSLLEITGNEEYC